jgi:catechol 2,3-dioxygenase-like lactoylglutathione lyase family enzyme
MAGRVFHRDSNRDDTRRCSMLKDLNSSAIVPCRDPERSRQFYIETLGLELAADFGEVFTLQTGKTRLHVYKSDEAGTNRANAVCWDCGDEIEAIVANLKSRGVVFEHYPDLPGLTLDGDVHRAEGFKAAWFKDPDGNILHINSM